MTTYKLTPKAPHPVTGFQNPLMGWHFVGSEALNVFGSFNDLDDADWDYSLGKDPDNRKLQRMSLTKPIGEGTTHVQHVIKDTQWYAIDGGDVIVVLDDDDATANYDITEYTPPPTQ